MWSNERNFYTTLLFDNYNEKTLLLAACEQIARVENYSGDENLPLTYFKNIVLAALAEAEFYIQTIEYLKFAIYGL